MFGLGTEIWKGQLAFKMHGWLLWRTNLVELVRKKIRRQIVAIGMYYEAFFSAGIAFCTIFVAMWLIALRTGSLAYLLSVVILCLRSASLFSLHPVMMSLTFVLLMSEGLLVFYPRNVFTRKLKKTDKTKIHWIIQTLAALAVGIGFLTIFLIKISNGKEHFTTWHGLLGLITICCVFITALIGAFTLYRMKIAYLIKPFRLKLIHGFAGILTLILGFICIGFGYSSTWATEQLNIALQVGLIIGLVPLCVAFVCIFKNM